MADQNQNPADNENQKAPAPQAAPDHQQHRSEDAFKDAAPSDDLQMQIETVVPDDHSAGVKQQSNTDPADDKIDDGISKPTEQSEADGEAPEDVKNSGDESTQNEPAEQQTEEDTDDTEDSGEEGEPSNDETSKKDDSGHGIETVAP